MVPSISVVSECAVEWPTDAKLIILFSVLRSVPGFTEAEAVELDALFTNSTLLVDTLEYEDDSIFEAHRIGRVAGSRGEFGNQRLFAESSAGSVHCKLLEGVANESALIHYLNGQV